ncbi:NAD(P)(+) transhydrogenase (AB-specific) [Ferrimonas balearica DSM 9799]|uniref:NAD(P) transhydrogenase subunit beta n=1 Tax=Ferrimonas balearica (strain DSM 9799 / CCM 4581 / KCTC 23876 / PAT) TaxID=550540 RepID=E1SVT9_FERBD|nr:NAD(P)(+) transhydrogenase (Re/Si-specific) subunit beta [Ferrimonas balearica]MBY6017908.1 NAD(P)(+) transhydrogenase (Re/Si-specific) subunit beta [Halomonas denitrificans]ADN77390.1 NAD(P)(+) transhydrogenase (AB-specific) [Ferrimonas balearica DSM 9799]MBW3139609.1 NAD(P)(+) transhydrogenase (Re/Si-specific) subunit beta [Ferrimonas balearica]MBW3164647.1 NAD(P)(+) transhydrogenase (Re/Si-specific) subunit beta [Ferrimonas balearica]MBY5980492.1 NAD(P)(+) transhydrogenase (Re/Si-specifi
MSNTLIYSSYLVAAVLFILGIKNLTKPRTAVLGNRLSSIGMLIAVVITLLDRNIISYEWIIAGMVLGGAIGGIMARRVQMTSMPEMVAMLNGFGGGASLFVALANAWDPAAATSMVAMISIGITVLIGAVTLSGSFVAFAKLSEKISGNPIAVPGNTFLNGALLLAGLALVAMTVIDPTNHTWQFALVAVALLLGLALVLPIGGADMPVVIALLNSYSGIAAATAGFISGNTVLIISGSLVGASGLILTQIMCKAMNRSLPNVLFGVMAEGGETIDADEVYAGKVKSSSPDEVGMLLETAERVVIVPGYGLAMAQAQHAVRELADVLQARGADVKYAIHPVAGRMPGHMNVLLAEAEVPYEQLVEMDEINPQFEQTDVAIVIGANDVTNPMAREDKGSPIYGMPILNVDKAKTVVVVKRSLSPGFAGLPNPLFAMDNSLMLFGDGKKAIVELTASLKEAG